MRSCGRSCSGPRGCTDTEHDGPSAAKSATSSAPRHLRGDRPQPPVRVKELRCKPARAVHPLPAPRHRRDRTRLCSDACLFILRTRGHNTSYMLIRGHHTPEPGVRRHGRRASRRRPGGDRTSSATVQQGQFAGDPPDARDPRRDRGRAPRPRRRRGGDLSARTDGADRIDRRALRGGGQDRPPPDESSIARSPTGHVEDLEGTPVLSLLSGPDRRSALLAKRLLDRRSRHSP